MSPFPFTLPVSLRPRRRGIRWSWRPALLRLAVLLLAGLTGFIEPAMAAKRVALVIGNNDYRNVPKLLKAVNDARTIDAALKQIGFAVMLAENQNRRQFSEALLAFDRSLEAGDTAFFFYSGHGYEIHGQNYLLPIDVPAATEGQEELVRDAAFSADRIIERLLNRNVRSAILVFDACRNNPFEREGVRALQGRGGLAPLTQLPEGVFSVFSAGPRQTALDRLSDDDANPNSVFTRIFARELLRSGRSLVQIAQSTRRSVSEIAERVGHKQVPVYFDQMVDEVFLNGKAAETATPMAAPGNAPAGIPPATTVPAEIAVVPENVEPQKVAVLPPVRVPLQPGQSAVNAPIASFFRHSTGWSVTFSIVDPALAISWRFGSSGDFQDTRLLKQFDPRTRKRQPSSSIDLPSDTPAGILEVRYVDVDGRMQGPFPIRFDPGGAVVREQRESLEKNANWLRFGGYSELLLYYDTLVEANCVVSEIFLDIDSVDTRRIIKTPPCNIRNPDAVSGRVRTTLKLPSMTRYVSVQLLYRDGTRSEVRTFRR
ncbi:MAG: caspase family protein [Alphaproteobacteria bacterium]|nr:caspase family protein [Alphaproteobacteria bacterium]